ncbi:MAG: hypothetical protein ACT4PM_07390 [Gemmatimonadales bacterium]
MRWRMVQLIGPSKLQAQVRSKDRMEIRNEQGVPVGTVERPTDPRPFGPDKGTVYLRRELPPAA